MSVTQTIEEQATPELEAIATAAADVVRADAAQDAGARAAAEARMAEAVAAAALARPDLDAIAQAGRDGRARARRELGADVVRRIKRGAQRKREAELDYEEAVRLAARIGMAHGEIAAAAGISPNGVRSVLARGEGAPASELTPEPVPVPTGHAQVPSPPVAAAGPAGG